MRASGGYRSLWGDTATLTLNLDRLTRDATTEVVIVGGGYTGLVAAHCLRAHSVPCIVLEAADIGAGASGLNGGSAVPRYKRGFAELATMFGTAAARQLHELVLSGLDRIESFVSEYGIPCDFRRNGQLTAAHSHAALSVLENEVRWLRSEVQDHAPVLLTAKEVSEHLGTQGYRGGYLDRRGAALHPLSYLRGLAHGLAENDVDIHVQTPALEIDDQGAEILVRTPEAVVRAKKLILATNGYTPNGFGGALSDLPKRFVTMSSAMIATEPLAEGVLKTLLPGGCNFSDTRHLLNYACLTTGGRFLFGGRGQVTGHVENPVLYDARERKCRLMFPQLGDARITHRWSGMVAVTLGGLPRIVPLNERIMFAGGYGGRGLVLSHVLGEGVAKSILGEPVDLGPLCKHPLKPIPFHAYRIPMMKVAAAYYAVRDSLGL